MVSSTGIAVTEPVHPESENRAVMPSGPPLHNDASALSLTVSSHFGGFRERCVRAPLWQGFGLPIWSTRKAWARRCDCRDTRQTVECATLDHSISRNILERLVGVAGSLARHLQHAFADDVALDLVGTAGDRARRHRHQDLRQQPGHRAVVAGQQRIRPQQRCMHASRRPGDDAGRQLAEGALGARYRDLRGPRWGAEIRTARAYSAYAPV